MMTNGERFFKIKSILQEKDEGFSVRGFKFLDKLSDEELFNPEKVDAVIRDLRSYEQNLSSPDNANKYPDYIMMNIRNSLGLDAYNTERDNEINCMDKGELFNLICSWNGFGSYGTAIKQWVEDIYNVQLDPQKSIESDKEEIDEER